MCPKDKHTIIELRSEDGTTLADGTAHANTFKRFSNMDFRGLLNDHPEGDKGLWNVKVVYFSLYQPLGMTNASSIDIVIDKITSPFVLSSKPRRDLTLASANVKLLRDVDNSTGESILPAGFFINENDAHTNTCRIDFTDWEVRLYADVDAGNSGGYELKSHPVGTPNAINDWVLRLEFSPYHNH